MRYSMSPYQKNILDIVQTSDNPAIGNIGGLVIWAKKVPFEVMQKCFALMIEKQPSLRLQLCQDYTWKLVPPQDSPLVYYDFTDKSEKEVREFAQNQFQKGFHLLNQPLYEFAYLEMDQKCMVFAKIHHLINDGASMVSMQHWLEVFSSGQVAGEIMVDNTYLNHLENQDFVSDRVYKMGIEKYTPVILQKDFPWKTHHAAASYEAERNQFQLPQQLYCKICEYVDTNNISIETIMLAAIHIYISKITGSDKTAVLRVMVNRRKRELKTVGCYANSLPQYMETPESLSFVELCHQIYGETFTLMKLSGFPFAQWVQKQNLSETISEVSVCYRNEKYVPIGINTLVDELYSGFSEIPLRVFINEDKNGIEMELQYQTDCYCKEEICSIAARWFGILEQVVNGNDQIKTLSICTEEDLKCIKNFNTSKKMIQQNTVLQKVVSQAFHALNAIAICYQGQEVSYHEMITRVNQLANAIYGQYGKQAGKVIGVHIERSIWLPVVLLAIWQCGAAFLPISVRESKERLAEGAKLCSFVINNTVLGILLEKAAEYPDDMQIDAEPNELAYLIFTSGTTGVPKAAQISQRSLAVRLQWMLDTYGCSERVIQKTPMTFDVSIWELFLPLISGNQLYLLSPDGEKNPEEIVQSLQGEKTVTIHFVPSMLEIFIQYCKTSACCFTNVKNVICSGEVLTPVMVDRAGEVFLGAVLCNFYGPAECTIDVSHTVCRPGSERISIGKPVYCTELWVVSKDRELLPPGIVGELCITGDLVGEGYCNESIGGFGQWCGKKAYFTGDYVTLDQDGQLYYVGRMDTQVKLRGMRIDLTSLSSAACKAKGVTWSQGMIQNGHLYLFYQGSASTYAISGQIKSKLPYFYMPSKIMKIAEIPFTQNGKLDEKSLLNLIQKTEEEIEMPATPTEKFLADYFCDAWQIESVSVKANLWDYGLDSLEILRAIVACKRAGMSVTYQDFMDYYTITDLSKFIDTQDEKHCNAVTWLNQGDSNNLIIAVPYAGGSTKTFWGLAENSAPCFDLAVVRTDKFPGLEAHQLAKKVKEQLPPSLDYENILILGCCVGSAVAIELANLMQHGNADISLVLAATLPKRGIYIGKHAYSYWNLVSDKKLAYHLSKLHQSKVVMSKTQVGQFRRDVERYLLWRKGAERFIFDGSLFMIFGDRDYFTKGFQAKCNQWKNIVDAKDENTCVTVLKGQNHFFVEESPAVMQKYLCDVINGEDTLCSR